ncbi:MAG: polyprenyl diphosphate synthase [Chlamydiales bacterium]
MFSGCPTSQKIPFFSEEDLALVQENRVPRHVALIMDGNRRWARKRIRSKITNPLNGHWVGAQALSSVLEASSYLGIKILTVYAFSTENWSRSPREINTLFRIFEAFLKENRQKMVDEGVHFEIIGDLGPIPNWLKEEIFLSMEATAKGTNIRFVVAMNYGARDEMRRAITAMVEEAEAGKLRKEEISEELIGSYLDTASFEDPDLLIRTGGAMRISNFLLWQLAYTEVYVTEVLWPDFTPHDLITAIVDFQKRERRRGH